MTFAGAVRSVLGQYATFRGRAGRPEFWWWMLLVLLADVTSSILDQVARQTVGLGLLQVAVSLGLLVPTLAVSVRRLHDSDLSGWWILAPMAASAIGVVLLLGGLFVILADGFSTNSGHTAGIGLVLFGLAVFAFLASFVVQLVLMLRAGTAGPNRFGPPTGAASPVAWPPPGTGYGPGHPPAW